ncbi:MAG: trigger factor [Planctomycetes bacterium]|nr:trigger factor [Planctomycetota bacterium]
MDVKVETVAPCKKRLSISFSADEVKAKMDERFGELEREAQVPGFRPGRAPRRLVEKRFRDAVRDETRAKLISEAFDKALQEQKLQVIGEPDVDPEKIEMPEGGPLAFSVDLEVRPEFELPDYVGIPVNVEQPTVTDQDVARALENLRESHGRLDEVPAAGAARENDIVTGDVAIQVGDLVVLDRQNSRMPVAPVAIEGIRLEKFNELLAGAAVGETRTARVAIGQDAEKEDLRGKEAEVRVKVNRLERVALPDDAALLAATDHEDLDALKRTLRRELEGRSDQVFRERQEQAVQQWLLDNVKFDLPAELAERHANNVLQRTVGGLRYRGVPVEEIEKRLADIRGASTDRAARELKLMFILDAIGKKENIEATDAEVDARVRFMAAQYRRRDDRLREEMEADGSLVSLRSQIREDKVVRVLLEKAKVGPARQGDAAASPAGPAPAAEGAPPPAAEDPRAEGQVEST